MPAPRHLSLSGLALATSAWAQPVVTSQGPDRVEVTIYRDPDRGVDEGMNVEWLSGYALISETRRVTIPAGESDIRFEGVAGGILPQSAIVTGLPDGIVERNRDAYLLSPESLLDRSLGRRVHLRRTSRATGAVREQDAVIRSGAGGAVVVQTAEGYESLRCTGLPEALVYDGVPAGLSARPTLSVRTRGRAPATATITLSYLASGFDWQANYVATLAPDGAHVDLFAWLVLGSSDETSFSQADTQAVAGHPRHEDIENEPSTASSLALRCWPQLTTSDIIDREPMPGMASPIVSVSAEEIRLSGDANLGEALNDLPSLLGRFSQRATEEQLGDLKLYRIPQPVTVAAHSVKQVAFLERTNVPVRLVYRLRLRVGGALRPVPADRILLASNRTEAGLGIALPGGRVQLFSPGERPILIGEGTIGDYAVGEEVEIRIGSSPDVFSEAYAASPGRQPRNRTNEVVLTVTNDRSVPIDYEALFEVRDGARFEPQGVQLPRRDGQPLWAVTVPANGSASLRYRYKEAR
jgi:hypothetical protein